MHYWGNLSWVQVSNSFQNPNTYQYANILKLYMCFYLYIQKYLWEKTEDIDNIGSRTVERQRQQRESHWVPLYLLIFNVIYLKFK